MNDHVIHIQWRKQKSMSFYSIEEIYYGYQKLRVNQVFWNLNDIQEVSLIG